MALLNTFIQYWQRPMIICHIENVRIPEVNKKVNRTILPGIKYLHPIESLQGLLLGERQPRAKIQS
jgi:hypothetical protein